MKCFFCFLISFISFTIFTANAFAEDNKGDYVIVLHGIARSSSHMQSVAEKLTEEGYEVFNLDYPSTEYKIKEIVEIVNRDLSTKLQLDKPVHFVGYSMGGIIVRALINYKRPKNLGKVVQLASPNHGSEVADFLKDNYLYQKIYGPAGQQLTTNYQYRDKLLGEVNYELGVIAGNSTIDPVSSYLIGGEDDGKVSINSTKVKGMKDHIIIPASHTFFPSNDEVHKQIIHFLKNGEFFR